MTRPNPQTSGYENRRAVVVVVVESSHQDEAHIQDVVVVNNYILQPIPAYSLRCNDLASREKSVFIFCLPPRPLRPCPLKLYMD